MENRSEKRQCHLWLIQLVIVLSIGGSSLLWASCATARSQAVGNDGKTARRDSMIIAYTYRQWMQRNWNIAEDFSKGYDIELDDVRLSIPLLYHDQDRRKLIAFLTLTMYNAKSKERYSQNDSVNKLCPLGPDTISIGQFVAGFMEEGQWRLYPMGAQSYSCYRNVDRMISQAKMYIEKDIRSKKLYFVTQDGPEKGIMNLRANDYGVLDPGFWTGGWLWTQDTVGSDSLYWFQNGGYVDDALEKCFKCIIHLVPPVVVLPDSLRIDEK